MNKLSKYINDSLEELRLVRWPTRQQAVRLSAIVIVFVAVSTAVLGFLDLGLAKALQFLLSLAN